MIHTLLRSFFVIFLCSISHLPKQIQISSLIKVIEICARNLSIITVPPLITYGKNHYSQIFVKLFFIHQVFLLKKFFKVTYFCLCKIVAMLETLAHMYQAADTFIIGDVSTIKYISIFKARCNFDVSIIFGKFIPPLHSNQQEFGFIFRNDFIFSPSSNIVASCNKQKNIYYLLLFRLNIYLLYFIQRFRVCQQSFVQAAFQAF